MSSAQSCDSGREVVLRAHTASNICHLPQTEHTQSASTDSVGLLVLKQIATAKLFSTYEIDVEFALKCLSLLTNVQVDELNYGYLSKNEYLIRVPNELTREKLGEHRSLVCGAGEYEIDEWSCSRGADEYKHNLRVWLEIYNVPIHYYTLQHAHCLVSTVGDVVEVDTESFDNDVGCLSICLDCKESDDVPRIIEVFYDDCLMVEADCKVVMSVELHKHNEVLERCVAGSYHGTLQNVGNYISRNKAERAFENRYRREFRDFVAWNGLNCPRRAQTVVSTTPADDAGPVLKARRLLDEFNSESYVGIKHVAHRTKCYLTATDATDCSARENAQCIVIEPMVAIHRTFNVQDVLEVLGNMHGLNPNSYKSKSYVNGNILVWMSSKLDRDDLVNKCDWIMVKGVKCFIKAWTAKMNATFVESKYRLWLEITGLPIHYYTAKQFYILTSHLGSVVEFHNPKNGIEYGKVRVCVDCVQFMGTYLSQTICYDGRYSKDIGITILYNIPKSVLMVVDPNIQDRSYYGYITELRKYMSGTQFEDILDSKYQGKYSEYKIWKVAYTEKDVCEFWKNHEAL